MLSAFEGRHVQLPVFLGKRPDEPVNDDLRQFYRIAVAQHSCVPGHHALRTVVWTDTASACQDVPRRPARPQCGYCFVNECEKSKCPVES